MATVFRMMCEFPLLSAEISLTRDPQARATSQMTLKNSWTLIHLNRSNLVKIVETVLPSGTKISLEFPLLVLEGPWPGLCMRRRSLRD